MTIEEAIGELSYAQAMCNFDATTGDVGFRNEEDRRQYEAFGMAIKALASLQRKTAHWEYNPDGMDWGLGAWQCSECRGRNNMIPTYIQGAKGKPPITHERINPYSWAGSSYCPYCGAKMEAEDEC